MTGLARIYIIVDIEAINTIPIGEPPLPTAFLDLFTKMSDRNFDTVVKVALISYGSATLHGTFEQHNLDDLLLRVGRPRKSKAAKMSQKTTRKQDFSLKRRGSSKRLDLHI